MASEISKDELVGDAHMLASLVSLATSSLAVATSVRAS